MPLDIQDFDALFCAAIEIEDDALRAKYVEEACATDVKLKQKITKLLEAHFGAGKFLAHAATSIQDIAPMKPGTMIGSYKLLEPIGEGGMGTVYMAEQTEPVRRRVAIKLIKPGMDSKQVIARFEAERQALAVMDHPNIAKVFDAGTTESGRPYFVMELVKGLPITKFCDEQKLSTEARLKLFRQVCQAVQHAHQKGIIHRDLKPSNIMIAMFDDQPVPKVIDFGVAKAINDPLTENTFFTRFGEVVGTLKYMSPEQAQFNQLDIDTRSDIYSLGAVLYELLVGEPPFSDERIKTQAFDETLRMIREEEPTKPSTKLASAAHSARAAISRNTTPGKLNSIIRGELDWIIMKSVEKDRSRRYETANEFAADIKRYLNNEAVLAGPPSVTYRFRKFARRNRGMLIAASIISILLVVGTGISTWQAIRATQAEQLANQQTAESKRQAAIAAAVQKFWNEDVLGQANPDYQSNRDVSLREVLDIASEKIEGKFESDPLVEAAIRQAIYIPLNTLGEIEVALEHCLRAFDIYEQHLGPTNEKTLYFKGRIGAIYLDQGDFVLAEKFVNETLVDSKYHLGPTHVCTLGALNTLGVLHRRRGELDKALACFEEVKRGCILKSGDADLYSIAAMQNCGVVLSEQGKNDEAMAVFRGALTLCLENLGPDHPVALGLRNNLAAQFDATKRYAAALEQFQTLLPAQEKIMGESSVSVLLTGYGLGRMLWKTGNPSKAEAVLLRFYQLQKKHHPSQTRALLIPICLIAIYADTDREDDATRLFEELSQFNFDSQTRVRLAEMLRIFAMDLREEGNPKACGYLCDRSNDWLQSVVDPKFQGQILKSVDKLILSIRKLGDQERLVTAIELGIKSFESLKGVSPTDIDDIVFLGGRWCDLGTAQKESKQTNDALESFARSKSLIETALSYDNEHSRANEFYEIVLFHEAFTFSHANQHQNALANYDQLLATELKKVNRTHVSINSARSLALSGQHQASIKLINSLDGVQKVEQGDLIYVAAVFSLASEACSLDQILPPANRIELADKYAERSLAVLETALESGKLTVAQLEEFKEDTDFACLKKRKKYAELYKLVDEQIAQKNRTGGALKSSIAESTSGNEP